MSGGVKVLIVDDQPAFRALATIWLRDGLRTPVQVVEADSLAQMREIVARERPDLVLVDQRLPDGAGLDGARELLAADPDATVLLLTGLKDTALDEEAERLGVTDFLEKNTIDGPQLARAVRYALRRREDAARLRRSAQELERAQDLARVGSWSWDLGGGEVRMSPVLLRIFGLDPDQPAATYASVMTRVPDEDARARLQAAQDEAVANASEVDVEFPLLRDDGARRVLLARFRGVPGPDGTVVRLEGVARDVTEQREAEEQREAILADLHEAQQRFRMAFEYAAAGIALLAPDGRVLEVNESAAQMLGYTVDELVGTDGVSYVVPAEQELARNEMVQVLAGGERQGRYERRFTHADGSTVHTFMTTALATDEQGAPRYFTLQLIDVSEQVRAQEELRASREHYRLVLANLPAIVGALDTDLRVLSVEGRALDLVDPPSPIAPGRRLDEVLGPEALAALEPHLRRGLAGEDVRMEFRGPRSGRRLDISISPYSDAAGEIRGVIVVARDVTEQFEALRARAAAEQRFQEAFERAPIGMSLSAPDGRLVRVNEAWSELTGIDARAAVELEPLGHVHPDDAPRVAATLAGLGEGPVTFEHRIGRDDGQVVWVQVRATLLPGDETDAPHVLAQVQDVTERREYEDRLRHLADHDPLTGLLNRRGLRRALEAHLTHARRYGAAGALLLIDLDGFKYINDTLGHSAGDELIIACAAALRHRLRETDVLARFGGDEFAVLLPGEDDAESEHVAEALVAAVREQATGFGGQFAGNVTASIGVAPFTDDVQDAEEMLVNADLAMYEAKEAGKDRFAVHRSGDSEQSPGIRARMSWLQRIDRALEEDRFVLHAQPVVDLARNEVVGHEVLLRMVGEQGELILPGAFLSIAERFGVIRDIDKWVMRRAIRAMRAVHEAGGRMPLGVNVSGVSTGDPELVALIADEIGAAGVAPHDLVVELTETAAVADIPRARTFAEALRALGCRFALDDFGAGFGSFYYLKHLPFDVLKIDGEFVKNAAADATDRLVISAVAEIARGLGKNTVAEFVPDDRTIELLLALGVDNGQGYHLGMPRPLEEVMTMLQAV